MIRALAGHCDWLRLARERVRRVALAVGLGIVSLAPTAPDAAAEEKPGRASLPAISDSLRWKHFPGTRGSGDGPVVVAVARAWNGDAEVAIADAAGIRRSRFERVGGAGPDAEFRTHVERVAQEGVRDLAFDRTGRLWIGTSTGLRVWAEGARPIRRSIRGGEADDGIHRIATHGEAIVLATDRGAFWSSSGKIFQPLTGEGAGTRVRLAAIRATGSDGKRTGTARPEEVEVWLLGEGALVAIRGLITPVGLRVLSRQRIPLPRPSSDARPRDLVITRQTGTPEVGGPPRILLVYPDAIAERAAALSSSSVPRDEGRSGWLIRRPVLAPGALMNRLSVDVRLAPAGGVAIATDRGLYLGAGLAGPFHRAPTPMGTETCSDLGGGRGVPLFIACRSGLHAFVAEATSPVREAAVAPGDVATAGTRSPSLGSPGPRASSPTLLEPDPPLAEIRRRVLERAGLDAKRGRSLWRGLRRRGYWPDVGLRFGADFDRGERRFADQAFSSGALRRLHDVTRERDMAFEVSIDLDWSLGEVAYPDDAVDLSRELRQVVGLRDDVSDELGQLYYERQRLGARLASGEPLAAVEAIALRTRAEELFAGLDAWTGGWMTKWRLDQRRRRATKERTPHQTGPDVMSPTRRKKP